MTPWELLDTAPVTGDRGELRLYRRGEEYSILVSNGGGELMNSRLHGSEDALAERACSQVADRARPRVLVGGLGMGFTLAAALKQLPPGAEVTVAELVPAVVQWNRELLGGLAGHPLEDPRTIVHGGDVGVVLKREKSAFDAILLDVDNGPEGLTRRQNDWLYSFKGLEAAFDALRSAGVLAIWSAGPDGAFADRLRQVGFDVEETIARAHGPKKGARHTIWLATRPS
ncbi:spermidine synthase [Thiohalomonas denitrificans]|uniref:Spermine/spermidine synthase n=1 Tax=Thiohalomonas denitrificans TaxID=415747 RepID=A0A1G5QN96_9GAMM|nr:hypothetical protein [Thiohalomonas denitrificans]SCZ62771.1 Spermine/spermidine synthase [Thiohalomonas denitrificans]